MEVPKNRSTSRGSHLASGIIGNGLLSSNADLKQFKDELDFAIGDPNSSGLLSKGILDEMRNNLDEHTKPSGRFPSKEISMRNP